MAKWIFFLLVCCSSTIAFAQIKHDYIWINGDNGEPSNPNDPDNHFGVNILDFNGGELNLTRDYRDTDFFLTNASICDTAGHLLFYSNGCNVFQADGELMENGAGMNPGVAYDTGNCPQSGNTMPKGMLILPLPGSDSLYYMFHGSFIWGEASPFLVIHGHLNISVVDMTNNNGLGKVILKNEPIVSDSLFADLHAVRHANGTDWWLITSKINSDRYYSILFMQDGVVGVFEQDIGPIADPDFIGMSTFSPDGTRYARYDRKNQILLYNFDRETGQLTNLIQLEADTMPEGFYGAVTFSPSGRFLYANSTLRVYQFDLEASDVQASRILLGEYDGYKYKDIFPADFGFMQLAPDCKIYFPTNSSTPFYHVIQYPDRKGLACGFQQRGLPLIATNAASIPNFPNYRLGTGFPVCDSTIQLVVSSIPVLPPVREVLVYPNPASSYITIEIPQPLVSGGEWSLYNGVGQRVVLQKMARGATRVDVPLGGVPPGLYFWEMRGGGSGRLGSGKPHRGRLVISQ